MTARLAVAALLLLASCQPPMQVTHVVTGQWAVPHTGDVRVQLENEPPPANFHEIAIVHAMTYEREATRDAVLAALRERAASLGCNALIRVRVDHGAHRAAGSGVCGVIP